jgi:subtilase family serine protease
MRLSLRIGGIAVATGSVVAALLPAAAQAAPSTTSVSGNVPAFATLANRVGPVSTSSRLTVSVYLTPRNAAALAQLAHDVSTPGTSSYRHYLTPAQFHDRFSPTDANVASVKNFLADGGLKVGSVASNNMYVDATGTVAQVEKAFNVTQATYAVQGQKVRANAEAPQIPSALAGTIQFVGGLDASQTLVKPAAAPPAPIAPALPCNTNSLATKVHITPDANQYGDTIPSNYCGLTPQQVRTAYGLSADWTQSDFTGAGVTVGITDAFASPTEPADVNQFSADHGLPPVDFTQQVVPGTFHYPENQLDAQGWYGEETLDLVAVHAIAPQAKIVYVGAQNNEVPLDHALEQLIDSNSVDVVTNSWGYNGEPSAPGHLFTEETAFQQAAVQGISVLFSSGDDGDVGAITGLAQASWPASSDWVTAVGGTSLLAGTGQEYGWGTYFSNFTNATLTKNSVTDYSLTADELPWPPEFLFGSGGGASPHVTQPSWQQGVVGDLGDSAATYDADGVSGSVDYATPRRVVPDVAMDADPYTGLLLGETFTRSSFDADNLNQDGPACTPQQGNLEYCETAIGGTSLASPLFAGVLALVDDAANGRVGFINPTIYGSGGAGFTDVLPPSSPLGFVRTRAANTKNGLSARFVTVNSTVTEDTSAPDYGADTTLRTTQGYDNVTGLGTPDVPALISALSATVVAPTVTGGAGRHGKH